MNLLPEGNHETSALVAPPAKVEQCMIQPFPSAGRRHRRFSADDGGERRPSSPPLKKEEESREQHVGGGGGGGDSGSGNVFERWMKQNAPRKGRQQLPEGRLPKGGDDSSTSGEAMVASFGSPESKNNDKSREAKKKKNCCRRWSDDGGASEERALSRISSRRMSDLDQVMHELRNDSSSSTTSAYVGAAQLRHMAIQRLAEKKREEKETAEAGNGGDSGETNKKTSRRPRSKSMGGAIERIAGLVGDGGGAPSCAEGRSSRSSRRESGDGRRKNLGGSSRRGRSPGRSSARGGGAEERNNDGPRSRRQRSRSGSVDALARLAGLVGGSDKLQSSSSGHGMDWTAQGLLVPASSSRGSWRQQQQQEAAARRRRGRSSSSEGRFHRLAELVAQKDDDVEPVMDFSADSVILRRDSLRRVVLTETGSPATAVASVDDKDDLANKSQPSPQQEEAMGSDQKEEPVVSAMSPRSRREPLHRPASLDGLARLAKRCGLVGGGIVEQQQQQQQQEQERDGVSLVGEQQQKPSNNARNQPRRARSLDLLSTTFPSSLGRGAASASNCGNDEDGSGGGAAASSNGGSNDEDGGLLQNWLEKSDTTTTTVIVDPERQFLDVNGQSLIPTDLEDDDYDDDDVRIWDQLSSSIRARNAAASVSIGRGGGILKSSDPHPVLPSETAEDSSLLWPQEQASRAWEAEEQHGDCGTDAAAEPNRTDDSNEGMDPETALASRLGMLLSELRADPAAENRADGELGSPESAAAASAAERTYAEYVAALVGPPDPMDDFVVGEELGKEDASSPSFDPDEYTAFSYPGTIPSDVNLEAKSMTTSSNEPPLPQLDQKSSLPPPPERDSSSPSLAGLMLHRRRPSSGAASEAALSALERAVEESIGISERGGAVSDEEKHAWCDHPHWSSSTEVLYASIRSSGGGEEEVGNAVPYSWARREQFASESRKKSERFVRRWGSARRRSTGALNAMSSLFYEAGDVVGGDDEEASLAVSNTPPRISGSAREDVPPDHEHDNSRSGGTTKMIVHRGEQQVHDRSSPRSPMNGVGEGMSIPHASEGAKGSSHDGPATTKAQKHYSDAKACGSSASNLIPPCSTTADASSVLSVKSSGANDRDRDTAENRAITGERAEKGVARGLTSPGAYGAAPSPQDQEDESREKEHDGLPSVTHSQEESPQPRAAGSVKDCTNPTKTRAPSTPSGSNNIFGFFRGRKETRNKKEALSQEGGGGKVEAPSTGTPNAEKEGLDPSAPSKTADNTEESNVAPCDDNSEHRNSLLLGWGDVSSMNDSDSSLLVGWGSNNASNSDGTDGMYESNASLLVPFRRKSEVDLEDVLEATGEIASRDE